MFFNIKGGYVIIWRARYFLLIFAYLCATFLVSEFLGKFWMLKQVRLIIYFPRGQVKKTLC